MDDITFFCPECSQKLAIQSSAAGKSIDCPRCCSTIVVPESGAAPVKVEVRRHLAIVPGTQDGAYQALETQKQKLREITAESERLRADNRRLEADLGRVRDEVSQGQREQEALCARLKTAEEAQAQLATLRSDCATLEQVRTELETRAQKAEEASSGLRDGLKSAEKECFELKAQIASLQRPGADDSTPAPSESLEKLQDQLSTVRAERDSLRINAGHALSELQSLRSELERLQAAAARTAEIPHEEERRVPGMESQLSEARAWGAELSREVADLQRQLDAAAVERDSTRRELHVAQSTRDELRQRLAAREAALIKTSLSGESTRHELERLRQTAAATGEERDRLKQGFAELEQEAAEMQQRVDGLLDQLHACEQRLEERTIAAAKLTAELDAARSDSSGFAVAAGEARAAAPPRLGAAAPASGELEELRSRLSHAEDALQTYRILIEEADRSLNEGQVRFDALNMERNELREALMLAGRHAR